MTEDAGIRDDRVAIACALGGVTSRERCASVPYTPEEFAAEARRAHDAGASQVHVHGRDPATGEASFSVQHCEAIVDAIRAEVPDIVINLSTGAFGKSIETRARPLVAKPDMATISMGSLSFATLEADSGALVSEVLFVNSFADIAFLIDATAASGIMVDAECYDLGHFENLRLLKVSGHECTFGQKSIVLGVPGGVPATASALAAMAGMVDGAHWEAVILHHPMHWRLMGMVIALGGSVRVGLEDNVFLPDGRLASSNGQLVESAVRVIESAGFIVAGSDDARSALKAY